MKALLLALAVASLLFGAFVASSPGQADKLATETQAHAVLQRHCYPCHGENGNSKGGFGHILDRDKLVVNGLVVPGDLKESLVFQRITAGEMPPAKRPRLEAHEIAVLKKWIEAGAQGWSAIPTQRAFLSDEHLEEKIAADLKAMPAKQRKFVRYFTAAQLVNAGRDDKEIETCELALGKLLNSLSWHPRLTLPQSVATGIYRIDLRDFKWTASSWERVLREYPYKVPLAGDQAELIAKWTGTEAAVIRADWFVATASQPPLYSDLLQLPPTDRALERLLQVDVMQNLQDEVAVRLGFNDSGVSKNNRLLERHDAAYGAYWRSYDFADNKGRQSLFEHPLGPAHGETSFKQDGGEMIFHLPNGLHGYMIVNAAGKRIDKAPTEVVADAQRPDQRVTTGVSCMSCHARGFLPKTDQVRGHVVKNQQAFATADVEAVLALYPPRERVQKLLDEDNAKYKSAIQKLGLKLEVEDPVNVVTRRYEAPVDLALAAAEMGLSPDLFRKRLTDTPALARILGPLAVKGGAVQREVFQDAFATSIALLSLRKPGPGSAVAATSKSSLAGSIYERDSNPIIGNDAIHCIAVTTARGIGAAGRGDKDLLLFDVASGAIQRRLEGHKSAVTAAAFSTKGMWLASASADRTVRVWDVDAGQQTSCLVGHADTVRCVAFSPDGWCIVSGGDDRSVRVWDHMRGREVHCLTLHTGPILAVAWAPDGSWFVSASQDGSLRQWEAKSGKLLAVFEGHVGAVHAVAVSPDGKTLLSGGGDKTVRLWDVATGKEQARLTGHANSVIAVAYSADGSKCLSASSQYRQADALFRLWDLKTAKEERRWGHDFAGSVSSAALAARDAFALTGGDGPIVRHWRLSLGGTP